MTSDHSPAAGKMVDIDELEKLAKEARPGPWFARTSRKIRSGVIHVRNADGHYIMEKNHAPRAKDDAYFIAAANPDAILDMIAELREAREDVEYAGANYQDLGRAWDEERTKVDEALGLSAPFSLEKTMAAIERMKTELRAAREVIGEIPKGTGAFFDLKAILKKRKAYDAAIGGEGTK